MLQNIGDKLKAHKLLGTVILAPLAVIFAAWGAYGIVDTSFGGADVPLKVGGEKVSASTLSSAWQQRLSQYQQQLGADIPEALKLKLQNQLLDEYADQMLLRQRAEKSGLKVGNADIAKAWQSESAFQVDGKFDPQAAKAILAQSGITPAAFDEQLRNQLEVEQLAQSIQRSDFLTSTEQARLFALENEQREVRYAILPAAKYAAAVQVDAKAQQDYYTAHQADYQTPESVDLQYAELQLDRLAAQVNVTPADLQAYYDKHKDSYVTAERRHAHHILIQIAAPKDAAADAAALKRARDVLAQARAGKDFGALAKQYSQDTGSAAQGGDLGWVDTGGLFKELSAALAQLKPGEFSEPVKTTYGYHILRLDEVQPAKTRTLEEAKADVEAAYRREQASDLFGDRQEALEQKLEAGSTDLQALAQQYDLHTGEIKDFTRETTSVLGASADLTRVAFSAEVADQGKLGGPVALSADHIVILRATNHQRPMPKSLDSVRDAVTAAIRKQQGEQQARAAAEAAAKQLKDGASFDATLKSLGVSAAPAAFVERADPQLPAPVLEAAFKSPPPATGKSVYLTASLDKGDAALIDLSAVRAGTAGTNPTNDAQLAEQYSKRLRQLELQLYVQELAKHTTIKRNPGALN